MKSSILLLSLVSTFGFAQEMPADNQCRAQAKEIALQAYQNCVSESRTAKIESIRKEYQEKISELKKHYETQIQELKNNGNSKSEAVETKELSISEPTIILKSANKQKDQNLKKANNKSTPVLVQNRAKGEKGVKGVAKTLPVKQKIVETKPILALAPESEVTEVIPTIEQELSEAQAVEVQSSQQ